MTLIYPDVDIAGEAKAHVRCKDLSIDIAFAGHIAAHVQRRCRCHNKGNDRYLFFVIAAHCPLSVN